MKHTREMTQELIDEFVGVAHGDFERVKTMLDEDPSLLNVNARWNETPIQAAAHTANREIAEYLLEAGAPLDICTATMLGMQNKVKEFLRIHAGLADATGAHGFPVMYYAAITGNQDLAETLLGAGAKINAGEGASTPLHGAVSFGQKAMVGWLLDHGAATDAGDYEGKTALFRAVQKKQGEIELILRAHGGTE